MAKRILLRLAYWTSLVMTCFLVLQAMFAISAVDPIGYRIGEHWEVGSNAVSIRALWSSSPGQSIAWDIVDSGWRFEKTDYDLIIHLPVLLILPLSVCVLLGSRWRLRRMSSAAVGSSNAGENKSAQLFRKHASRESDK